MVGTEKAVAIMPDVANPPRTVVVELDLLNDGSIYSVYNIFDKEDGRYVEIEPIKEMTEEEFNQKKKENVDRWNNIFKHFK